MLKFTTLDGKVIIDPSVLLVKEFTDMLDNSKDKDIGNKMLLYVFFCCDLSEQNLLRDVDYRLKEDQAFSRVFSGTKKKSFSKKEKSLIEAAMDAYNFFNETALERATLSYDQKTDEIRTLLDDLKPEVHTTLDDDGNIDKYVSNNKIIADFSKQLGDMAIYKLQALETAKKIENTGRVRGGKGSSLIERGGFRRDTK